MALAIKNPLQDFRSKEEKVLFLKVNGHSRYFYLVKNIFSTLLQKIYGNQEKALHKIVNGLDRTCEIMFVEETPIGILVYKNKLQEEYGLKDAFELKTLLLFNPKKNSDKGFGSMLISRTEEIAKQKNAKVIYCTCSEKNKDSLRFIQKKGFKITKKFLCKDRSTKYLIIKQVLNI